MADREIIHEKASYLGDAVFSASDGIVTTFAIVAGSAGASLDVGVVLVLGFANLFADGFSMAAGNYLGVKSEIDFEEAEGSSADGEGPPIKHAFVTFVSFNIAGFLPLVPFVFNLEPVYTLSTIFVGLTLFAVGFLRSVYTKQSAVKSGVEMLFVGGFAAFVAFLVGFLLRNYVL